MERHLTKEEIKLISALIKDKPNVEKIVSKLPKLLVEEMQDGGMGSLRFIAEGNSGKRKFGSILVEAQFMDQDNVPVSVALNLDTNGELYELDIWKVDFSPLIRFPAV